MTSIAVTIPIQEDGGAGGVLVQETASGGATLSGFPASVGYPLPATVSGTMTFGGLPGTYSLFVGYGIAGSVGPPPTAPAVVSSYQGPVVVAPPPTAFTGANTLTATPTLTVPLRAAFAGLNTLAIVLPPRGCNWAAGPACVAGYSAGPACSNTWTPS